MEKQAEAIQAEATQAAVVQDKQNQCQATRKEPTGYGRFSGLTDTFLSSTGARESPKSKSQLPGNKQEESTGKQGF